MQEGLAWGKGGVFALGWAWAWGGRCQLFFFFFPSSLVLNAKSGRRKEREAEGGDGDDGLYFILVATVVEVVAPVLEPEVGVRVGV